MSDLCFRPANLSDSFPVTMDTKVTNEFGNYLATDISFACI